MRRFAPLLALAVMTVAVSVANADTIYLKNGSVIKGKVTSFSDDQFAVQLNTSSRAQIYIGDVARIEFDGGGAMAADSSPVQPQPERMAKNDQPSPREESGSAAPNAGSENPPPTAVTNPPGPEVKEKPAGGGESARDSGGDASARQPRDTEAAQPQQPADDTPPPLKGGKGPIKTANVDVIAKRDWTSSGLIVKRGDRIRIRASGTVTLDPNSGVTSGPEGIDQQDPKKLMQDKPTGSLIAVIGADNDDFIFIGKTTEFTAARDGLLFLSVNEGTLSDNSGSFKAVIEVASAH